MSQTAKGSSPRVRGKRRRWQPRPWADRLIPARAGKTCGAWTGRGLAWAHPRACGENVALGRQHVLAVGSSPRVRGKRRAGRPDPGVLRLIPARAGKTPPRSRTSSTSGAHPRACGENGKPHATPRAASGSSPRVRGKRPSRRARPWQPRLIPARAGKTSSTTPIRSCSWAHPRACGENGMELVRAILAAGSSPRVRGKRPVSGSAYARGVAHPRACGENAADRVPGCGCAGSSPRVRGKRRRRPAARQRPGLIPARAGKTPPESCPPPRRPAHPRACGENPVLALRTVGQVGSSPRVRGKLLCAVQNAQPERLIPARAGKTTHNVTFTQYRRAHPRACGENDSLNRMIFFLPGSSPRVRGKPADDGAEDEEPGLIPARAGKTHSQ